MSTNITRYALVAAVLLVAACARLPQPSPTPANLQNQWSEHQQAVSELSNWDIMGKLGIRTPEQSNSARFNWQQQAQHFDINVTTLLGQGVATLSGSSGDVYLNIAGHGEFTTHAPEALLLQELGWTIPVRVLHYWVRGIPAPDSQARYQLNEQGLLDTLQQAGWKIQFSRYKQLESHRLPGKIQLQQNDIKLTLLIKRWTL